MLHKHNFFTIVCKYSLTFYMKKYIMIMYKTEKSKRDAERIKTNETDD